MFKKTLLALAITGFAGNAMAAASTGTSGGLQATTAEKIISAEGAEGTTTIGLGNLVITLGADDIADYTSLNDIEINVTGATLTPATTLAIAYADVAQTAGDGTIANLAANGTTTYPTLTQSKLALATADFQSAFDGSVGDSSENAEATDTFTISGLIVAPNSGTFVAGEQISVEVKMLSSVGGAVIETITIPATIVKAQFGFTAVTGAALAGTDGNGALPVDTADARMSFLDTNSDEILTDTVTATITSAKVDLLAADATGYKHSFVLNGDFNFMDDDADFDVESGNSVVGVAGVTTYAADLMKVTLVDASNSTFDGTAADTEGTNFAITVDGERAITTQAFTLDATFDYDTDAGVKKSQAFSAKAAGSWVLNGSSDAIAFLPFGSEYAQSITVTNSGSVAGAVTVDLTADGTTYTTTLTAEAAAKSVTNISIEVADFAAESGITGNARVKVVVNAPSANIAVKGVYYHRASADRVLTY